MGVENATERQRSNVKLLELHIVLASTASTITWLVELALLFHNPDLTGLRPQMRLRVSHEDKINTVLDAKFLTAANRFDDVVAVVTSLLTNNIPCQRPDYAAGHGEHC
ncbi:hypothetical protein LTR27_001792 [Elasticomyces elasticus]|nr:hypothetical protein LTR27_001792 [Elasticomyces elasticus]